MSEPEVKLPKAFAGLSARLLLLTIAFVMLAELLIWAPSVSKFRLDYLQERVTQAYLATLAYELVESPEGATQIREQLLSQTDTYGIVRREGGKRVLIESMNKDMPLSVDQVYDLEQSTFLGLIGDAFDALAQSENRVLKILGVSPRDPETQIEIILDERSMRHEMIQFSWRILTLSLGISFFTAGLLYCCLQIMMIGPMRRMIVAMAQFRAAPEDETRDHERVTRSDEIGVAFRELAHMQDELRAALKQKDRLATLGAAVAKINHDLRNTLATAMLVSDSLIEKSEDPDVQRLTPRLYKAVDHAVQLCSQTLNYVSDAQPKLDLNSFSVTDLVCGVGAELGTHGEKRDEFEWNVRTDDSLMIHADHTQLYRVIMNLGLNAMQAGATKVTLVGERDEDGKIAIDVVDNGPGLPPRALKRLFEPFAGSARDGGTGLGLVIARDIMRAHGGNIRLQKTDETGTTFRLTLPDRVEETQAA